MAHYYDFENDLFNANDFYDSYAQIIDMETEAVEELEQRHQMKKRQRAQRRKNAFRAGKKRWQNYFYYGFRPENCICRNQLRKCYIGGSLHEHFRSEDSKKKRNRWPKKRWMSMGNRKRLEAMEYAAKMAAYENGCDGDAQAV